jgi:2'-5' RNA ligase
MNVRLAPGEQKVRNQGAFALSYAGDYFTSIVETVRPSLHPEQNFALVLNTPPEIALALDDIRRRYDPAYKMGITPHITVKRPALLGDEKNVDPMRRVLREVAATIAPISVQVRTFDTFRTPDSNVLFLKVEDEQPLRELHQNVLDALSRLYPDGRADQFENSHYHPHLTIGNKLSELDLAVLEYELSNGNYQLDFNFTLDRLSLLVQEGDKPWQGVEEFYFTGNSEQAP